MAAKANAFDVGDYVVYPKHGVGERERERERDLRYYTYITKEQYLFKASALFVGQWLQSAAFFFYRCLHARSLLIHLVNHFLY